MSTKRATTSQLNGALSRGPITPEGKAASARNSRRHGLLSRSLVLESESASGFESLLKGLIAELEPQSLVERGLVESMAVARWRQMRIWALEKSGFDHEIRKQDPLNATEDTPTRAALAFRTLCDQSRALEIMNRYEARFDRQYARALRQFYLTRDRRSRPKH